MFSEVEIANIESKSFFNIHKEERERGTGKLHRRFKDLSNESELVTYKPAEMIEPKFTQQIDMVYAQVVG